MSFDSEDPNFQYELVRSTPRSGLRDLETWLELREEGRGVFSPVILDSRDNYFLQGEELAALKSDLPKILAKSEGISVEEFFRSRRAQDKELYEELEAGSWPSVPMELKPYLITQMEEVFIAKVPTSNSYEAVAYIGFGGWNDCPYDEEHVAILRYWHKRYGANLFAQGGDMLECTVDRPPTSQEAALSLAREHLTYALGTLGEFGRGNSVPELAAALLNSRHWLFWWD